MPEIASRAHVELINDVIEQALVEAGIDARRARRGRGGARARARGRVARRRERGEGDRARDRPAVRRREPSRGAHVRRDARGPDARAAARHARRVGRAHAADRDGRPRHATECSARPSTTPRARRSTRSRASSGSAIPAARRSTGSRATAIRDAIAFPRPMLDDGYDFSFSGLKTAVVQYVPQASRRRGRRRRGVVPGRGRRRARRPSCSRAARETRDRRRSWSAAASPPTRACATGSLDDRRRAASVRVVLPSIGAVHRQRGDGRRGGRLPPRRRRPDPARGPASCPTCALPESRRPALVRLALAGPASANRLARMPSTPRNPVSSCPAHMEAHR